MRLILMPPALLILACAASAQPLDPKIAAVKPPEPAATIPLRHVPATLMRRWLVPRQPARAAGAAKITNVFDLPEGVREVLPVEAEAELRVRATPEGLRGLRDIVDLLDKPLRHVVLQVRVLKIEREALRQLPGDWTTADIVGPFTALLGFARGQFEEALLKMVDAGQATQELDEVALIVNNLTGALGGPKIEARLTPTINNDNTITVLMQLDTRRGEMPGEKQQTKTVANVRDRNTTMVAIPPADGEAGPLTLILITPSIVTLPAAPAQTAPAR